MARTLNQGKFDSRVISAITAIWMVKDGILSETLVGFAENVLFECEFGSPIKRPTKTAIRGMEALNAFLDECAVGSRKPPPALTASFVEWASGEIRNSQEMMTGIRYLKATFSVKKSWLKRLIGIGNDVPYLRFPTHTELIKGRSALVAEHERATSHNLPARSQPARPPEPDRLDKFIPFETDLNGDQIGISTRQDNGETIYEILEVNPADGSSRALVTGATRAEVDVINDMVAGRWHEVPAIQARAAAYDHVTKVTSTYVTISPIAGSYEQPSQPWDDTPDASGDTPIEQLARDQEQRLEQATVQREANQTAI